jgi:hypothetical protein
MNNALDLTPLNPEFKPIALCIGAFASQRTAA